MTTVKNMRLSGDKTSSGGRGEIPLGVCLHRCWEPRPRQFDEVLVLLLTTDLLNPPQTVSQS